MTLFRSSLPTVLALALSSTAAAQTATPPAGVPAGEVPATLQPALARAELAMNALQAGLLARLKDEMARSGAAGALRVCHDEARTIAERVSKEQGIALGRTSHRLRNPANASPAWALTLVRDAAARPAAQVALRVFDLGDRVGVARPIGLAEMCTSCHGRPDALAPGVRDAVATLYPSDQATGFAPGDLRGWMWAEVPRP